MSSGAHKPACPVCGTWRCKDCGWQRNRANRYSYHPQRCGSCMSFRGEMLPLCHQDVNKTSEHMIEALAIAERQGRKIRYPLEGYNYEKESA